ncbi:MAG: O-antigen ligase family protein [Rhodospirillaceae bacterium]
MHALQRYVPAYAILSMAAVLIVPISTLEPLWLTIIAALATLAAMVAHGARGAWPRTQRTLTLLMAALVVWGAASASWSLGPDRSISQAFELLLFAAGTTVLVSLASGIDPAGRRQIERFLMIGFGVGLLFVMFELLTSGFVHSALNGFYVSEGIEFSRAMNLFHLNRGASVITLMIWVTVIPVWRRFGGIPAVALVLVSAYAVSALQPGAPFLAIVAGAGVFVLGWYLPRLVMAILLVAIVGTLLMVPFLNALEPVLTGFLYGSGLSEFSLHHRMAIWQFASEHTVARPLAGWGLDSSRLIGEGQLVTVDDAPNVGFRDVDVLPLHPHNALLQAWLELGVVGAVILAGLFATVLLAIARYVPGRLERGAAYAAFTAAFLTAQLSFGIWQGWWISTLALVAVLIIALVSPPRADADTSGQA